MSVKNISTEQLLDKVEQAARIIIDFKRAVFFLLPFDRDAKNSAHARVELLVDLKYQGQSLCYHP